MYSEASTRSIRHHIARISGNFIELVDDFDGRLYIPVHAGNQSLVNVICDFRQINRMVDELSPYK